MYYWIRIQRSENFKMKVLGLIWEVFEKPAKVSQAVKSLVDFYGLS